MSRYTKIISEMLSEINRSEIDPRHIEGYMRDKFGTLDHLDRRAFKREVLSALACVDQGGKDQAESLAQCFGIRA